MGRHYRPKAHSAAKQPPDTLHARCRAVGNGGQTGFAGRVSRSSQSGTLSPCSPSCPLIQAQPSPQPLLAGQKETPLPTPTAAHQSYILTLLKTVLRTRIRCRTSCIPLHHPSPRIRPFKARR